MLKNVFIWATALLIMSCNDSSETATSGSGDSTKTKSDANNTTSKKLRATINLKITGGEKAGTYEATCSDACCSYGIAGDKVFGNQYSENGKGPNELSSVQLLVNDVSTGKTTSNEFLVTVSFGELFGQNSISYTINTQKGKQDGSGTVTIDYSGESARVTILGKTQAGVEIDLTMECHKVLTGANLLEE